MKILHCCLACFYIDNYGYQENILPKMHKLQGHKVQILASTETFIDNMNLGYVKPRSYLNEFGIHVDRISYVSWLPHFIVKKVRLYIGIGEIIQKFSPDIIFLHDVQFLSIFQIISYLKKNTQVKIFADGHTDFNVSARNWLSKNILHKIIYRFCAQAIEPYLVKFYGVLPIRVEFIKNVYKISPGKVELLVMGGDLTEVSLSNKSTIRKETRSNLGIHDDVFLIITGGKIEKNKNITALMKAIVNINNPKIKLIVFGEVSSDVKNEFELYETNHNIIYVGWKTAKELPQLFLAADFAVYPGRHSVLWEQTISYGIPCAFKYWYGMDHLDVGGNCIFIKDDSVEEIQKTILKIHSDPLIYKKMLNISITNGTKTFSYYEIAQRAIKLQ